MMSTAEPRRPGRPPSGGRQAILDAAIELLRDDGIANLTSRAVAARAGVSDASVYYHFKDRAGLVLAAFRHGMAPLADVVTDEGGRDVLGVLRRYYDVLVDKYADVMPLLMAAQADPELGGPLADHLRAEDLGPHKSLAVLAAEIRRAQAAGLAHPDADPEAVAMLVINAAFARVARAQMRDPDETDPRLPTPERIFAAIARLLAPA